MSSRSTSPACFKNSTVLITGASGFIGGHLVAALKKTGANIVGIDRKSSAKTTGSQTAGSDVSQSEQVERVFKSAVSATGKPIEYIFHLAGQKSAALARENPLETLKSSFNGTLNILESSRVSGTVKKVVLISSLAVYGAEEDHSGEMLKESDPVYSDSIYSATKISTETIGLAYYKDFSIPVSVARLSNVYGPLQSSAAVIPSLIHQMKNGKKISMGNTASVRDFIHVQDVVDALIILAANDATTGNIFNVSTAQGTSVKTITDLLSQHLNYSGEIEVDKNKLRPNEKKIVVADNSKIKKTTGWFPKVKIDDGLKSLCQ
jgi:nucleoside-diphosphate-sugar epimerase